MREVGVEVINILKWRSTWKKHHNYIGTESDCQWTFDQFKDIAKTDDDDLLDRTIISKLKIHHGAGILIESRSYNMIFVLFKDSLYNVLQVNFIDDQDSKKKIFYKKLQKFYVEILNQIIHICF